MSPKISRINLTLRNWKIKKMTIRTMLQNTVVNRNELIYLFVFIHSNTIKLENKIIITINVNTHSLAN